MKQKNEDQLLEESYPPSAPWKQWVLVALGVIGVFVLINGVIWGVYRDRTYPGVRVGGYNLGNTSRVGVRAELGTITRGYVLTILIKNTSQQVAPSAVGLSYDLESSTTAAVATGKQYMVPLYGLVYTWANGSSKLAYTLDKTKLQEVALRLAGPDSNPATDAKVVINGEQVTVEPDKDGRGVDPKLLQQMISDKVAVANKRGSAAEQATKAKIDTDKARVASEQARKIMDLAIDVQVGGKRFKPDKTEIGKWLSFAIDKDNALVVVPNNDVIGAYVASVAGQVDVAAVTKQINMVNGEVRTVNDGRNGSALDRDAIVKALEGAIADQKAMSVMGTMSTVAFKTRTNSTVDLDGKYIEVNLSRQHLWAYNDKQLVYDTPITSGATGAGFATIQGLFSIKAKQMNRNLNGYAIGYNYNVFVNYWMPFSGNYGMHDASWRTSFGGSDYYYGGSHGCVNLPAAAAAWVYNFVDVGTPVWVHS